MSIDIKKLRVDNFNKKSYDAKDENDRQYARNHIDEQTHIIFHGGCLSCVTPLHYGLGNCLGCMYFEGVTSGKPSLKIENFVK